MQVRFKREVYYFMLIELTAVVGLMESGVGSKQKDGVAPSCSVGNSLATPELGNRRLYRAGQEVKLKRNKKTMPDNTTWRVTIRFRHGTDDDLIEYLRSLPSGHRAGAIREAVRQAMQAGMTYDGRFSQCSRRDQPDMRITVRFHCGENGDTIAYLRSLPSRKRSAFIRQALRVASQKEQ